MEGKSYLKYQLSPDVIAFSTKRHGGFGEAAYSSFNCTHYCGDNPAHVASNRDKLCKDWNISPDKLIIPRQTHSCRTVLIDQHFFQFSDTERETLLEGCDALMTTLPACCLCISTADCIPILIYDKDTRAIAAIHAGWRGTVGGITRKTVEMMKLHFGTSPSNISAIIGPGISVEAFEVGDEVYEAFRQAGFDMQRIARHQEKWHIDLWEANRIQLLEQGIKEGGITTTSICTYQQHTLFFSARRNGILSGRILTGIMRTG